MPDWNWSQLHNFLKLVSHKHTSLVIWSYWAPNICMHTVTRTFGLRSPFDESFLQSSNVNYRDKPRRFNERSFLKECLTHQCLACHTMAWKTLKQWSSRSKHAVVTDAKPRLRLTKVGNPFLSASWKVRSHFPIKYSYNLLWSNPSFRSVRIHFLAWNRANAIALSSPEYSFVPSVCRTVRSAARYHAMCLRSQGSDVVLGYFSRAITTLSHFSLELFYTGVPRGYGICCRPGVMK